MNSRNNYLDSTLEKAQAGGYDITQLKYDGWWTKAVVIGDETTYHSETGRPFATASGFGLDGCILIGEFMRGTQWSQAEDRKGLFFVYDIWALFGEPIVNETYIQRYKMLRTLKLPSVYRLVNCFRTTEFDAVWQRYVLNEGYEGVVFRRSDSRVDAPILRLKQQHTLEGVITGFRPGVGKHEGRLGSLEVTLDTGAMAVVGTGFSDDERDHFWSNRPFFLGKRCEFVANAVFDSGNVRHARYVRWREDKV